MIVVGIEIWELYPCSDVPLGVVAVREVSGESRMGGIPVRLDDKSEGIGN